MGNNFTEGKKNSWHIWKGVWVESCQRQDFAQKKGDQPPGEQPQPILCHCNSGGKAC